MKQQDFLLLIDQIESERISKREDLKESIQKMIESPKPFFMEVVVGKEDNVFPMIDIKYSDRNSYYNSLERCQVNAQQFPFVNFIVKRMLKIK